MPPDPGPVDLASREPRTGERLAYDGLEWEVTGFSSYDNEEGYRVQEWCCETSDMEAYLLREAQAKGDPRWFFTRWVDSGTVSLRGGEALNDWLRARPWEGRGGTMPEPPTVLVREGRNYIYADTTEGSHTEDGETTRKTTWDYWDEDRERNVAVELWADGAFDSYNGRYIQPSSALILPARPGALPSLSGLFDSPYMAAGVMWFLTYAFNILIIGLPFDQGAAATAGLGLLLAQALFMETLSPVIFASWVLCFLLGALFFMQHPISSLWGALGLVGGPAAVAWLGVRLGRTRPRLGLRYLAACTALLPAGAAGYYHYMRYAPGPRTLGQLLLALAPAFIGGAVAHLLAGRIAPEEGAS